MKATSETLNREDAALLERFRDGEEAAFRALFERYANPLVNFSYRFLSSRAEAEDIAQEVLLRVYKARERFDAKRPFRPWLFSIARRLTLNRVRDRKRRSEQSLDGGPADGTVETLMQTLPDSQGAEPGTVLERRAISDLVQTALGRLAENQRIAVILSRFEEMSYEEIAETMDLSVSAVESLLVRAKRTLREILSPYVTHE